MKNEGSHLQVIAVPRKQSAELLVSLNMIKAGPFIWRTCEITACEASFSPYPQPEMMGSKAALLYLFTEFGAFGC